MLFVKDITVLTTHTSASMKEDSIELAHGIMTWVSVSFPKGCHGLVNCRIFHREHQIYPSRANSELRGDGEAIEWAEYYEMYQPPYELLIRSWATGTVYDHVITVRIAVLPRKAVLALSIADAIKGMFGALLPKRIFTAGEKKAE